ncbi:MAG: hypothetical protein IPL12_02085 [Bacteroidetes bacterium]|nr:hypothetical protein [Bacteroidota bacterium]
MKVGLSLLSLKKRGCLKALHLIDNGKNKDALEIFEKFLETADIDDRITKFMLLQYGL